MRQHPFVYFLVIAVAAGSPLAWAGAGQTSSGVSTSIGTTDPTAASAGVQSQSSNFVQQNQALQPGGTAVAGSGNSAAAGVNGRNAANGDPATGKPGGPNNPAIDPKTGQPIVVAPAAPPAPPPEYVSNIKKVDRSGTTGVAVAAAEPDVSAAAKPKSASAPGTDVSTPATPTAPGSQRQATVAPRAPRPVADAEKHAATARPVSTDAPSGGSGAAPDSYAFYIGLVIAGALLAFAAATFMRAEKGGAK